MSQGRSFLYDDYMENELVEGRGADYGREFGNRRDYSTGGGPSLHQGSSLRHRNLDMGLDDYANIRRGGGGILSRNDPLEGFTSNSVHARRFADAAGIPSSTRAQHSYDDLEFGTAGGSRVIYRDAPRQRPQVVRRVVGGRGRRFVDAPQIVEVIERVARPQRRVQVIRKVPIHQRVVKKVIVKKVSRPDANRRTTVSATGGRVQRRNNIGGIQKNKKIGGRPAPRGKRDSKPKLSATDLDRELDEYMKSSKHPRVAV